MYTEHGGAIVVMLLLLFSAAFTACYGARLALILLSKFAGPALHTVFGNTWRWVQNPGSLDVNNIDYAMISEEPELRLFPAEQWAIIYKDMKAFLLLRRTPKHTALIERYEIRYFLANQAVLDSLAGNPRIYPRLMLETSTYLTYRRDAKIASAFAALINLPAGALLSASRDLLVHAVCRANSDTKALSCPSGS